MAKNNFYSLLQQEVDRIDTAHLSKRQEKIIERFTGDHSPKAVINGKEYGIFNSNDYLGLRFHPELRKAEQKASHTFGTGPGAVRFISGTMQVYKDLERAIAKFHNKEDAIVFSSAFAANMAVLFCLIRGQSKDSVVDDNVFVISDELNHRSIIDGIRIANLPKEQKTIYRHADYADLERILSEQEGKWKRVLVITDGIFSMIGEAADMQRLSDIVTRFDSKYERGVVLLVDDSHGVAACGATGRGCEELTNGLSDVLVGTFGKGFGSDGGYAVGSKVVIDYLRESAATYIYSNSVSPSVAGAALRAVQLIDEDEGKRLLKQSQDNIVLFKELVKDAGLKFSADSIHPIQPVLVGDPGKSKALTQKMFEKGILVTSINYPVVAKGKDEIRVQISAAHTKEDIEAFVQKLTESAKELEII